jgi:hypothetical protein
MLATDQSSSALSTTAKGTGLRQQNTVSASAVADAGKPKAVNPPPSRKPRATGDTSWLRVNATSAGTNAEHRRKSSAPPVAGSAFPAVSLGRSSVAAHPASDTPRGRHESLADQKQPSPRPIAPVDLSSVAGPPSSRACNTDLSPPGPVALPAVSTPRSKSPSPRSNGPVANTASSSRDESTSRNIPALDRDADQHRMPAPEDPNKAKYNSEKQRRKKKQAARGYVAPAACFAEAAVGAAEGQEAQGAGEGKEAAQGIADCRRAKAPCERRTAGRHVCSFGTDSNSARAHLQDRRYCCTGSSTCR